MTNFKTDLARLRELAEKIKGPCNCIGLSICANCCNRKKLSIAANPQTIIALLDLVERADELIESIYPIINLDCAVMGTCKDCLEDGRGTHSEQCEYALEKYHKLREALTASARK